MNSTIFIEKGLGKKPPVMGSYDDINFDDFDFTKLIEYSSDYKAKWRCDNKSVPYTNLIMTCSYLTNVMNIRPCPSDITKLVKIVGELND